MKKTLKKVLLAILAIFIIAVIGFTAFVGRQVFQGYSNATSREETVENISYSKKSYDELVDKYKLSKIDITKDNSDIKVPAFLVQKEGNHNIAVLVHGMGGTKESMADLVEGFLDIGYDVLAYDQRNSGENMADYNTFGVLESDDTLAVLSYIVPKYKDKYQDAKSILWGESYGGLTSIIAAGREDYYIDYLILESSISDGRILLKDVMEDATKGQDIPMSYLMAAGDWYSRFAVGIKFSDFDGLKWIKNVSKPVLITNSKDDTLTPPYMAEDIFKAISHDKKVIHLVDGYKHASFPKNANDEYMKIVKDFLKKYESQSEDADENSQWF